MINLKLGDCLEIMREIPDDSIDMILCDPPYGTTACKWDSIIDLELMWVQIRRIIKFKSAIVLTSCQPFTTTLISSNIKMFKYCWVWEKSKGSNFQHSKFQPLKVSEDVCVFSFGGSAQGSKHPMVYNPVMTHGKEYVGYNNPIGTIGTMSKGNMTPSSSLKGAKRYPRSVQYFKTAESEGKLHPTQKPIALMEYFMKTYTNEGDVVLDFAMGSGTTGVACVRHGRDFFGIEIDKKYFDIARERVLKEMNNFSEGVIRRCAVIERCAVVLADRACVDGS